MALEKDRTKDEIDIENRIKDFFSVYEGLKKNTTNYSEVLGD